MLMKKGTNPFFRPEYLQFGNGIYTNYIAPCLYLFGWILIIIGLLGCLISSVSASVTENSTVNLSGTTPNSISWDIFYKEDYTPIGATFDGVEIEGFQLNYDTTYTATDLEENSTHSFCIYDDFINNCESGKTSQSKTSAFIDKYFIIIISVLLMFVAFRIPFFGLISVIFATLGMVQSYQTGDFWFILVFACVFLASVFIFIYTMKNPRG